MLYLRSELPCLMEEKVIFFLMLQTPASLYHMKSFIGSDKRTLWSECSFFWRSVLERKKKLHT